MLILNTLFETKKIAIFKNKTDEGTEISIVKPEGNDSFTEFQYYNRGGKIHNIHDIHDIP